ncbi:MAG: DnaJ domain-containing protein [Saprospiraceae bacterium]|nr:DnaJ domain-containing protein [Saprospiraceae bacterium]
MKDYYYILGVPKDATKDDIKTAYRKLSLKFHPDKNPGDAYFEERFKDILEAYEYLMKLKGDQSSYSKKTEEIPDPVILTFKCSKSEIEGGEEFELEWETKYCVEVNIKPLGSVPTNGNKIYRLNNLNQKKDIRLELIGRNTLGKIATKYIILKNKTIYDIEKVTLENLNKGKTSALKLFILGLSVLVICFLGAYVYSQMTKDNSTVTRKASNPGDLESLYNEIALLDSSFVEAYTKEEFVIKFSIENNLKKLYDVLIDKYPDLISKYGDKEHFIEILKNSNLKLEAKSINSEKILDSGKNPINKSYFFSPYIHHLYKPIQYESDSSGYYIMDVSNTNTDSWGPLKGDTCYFKYVKYEEFHHNKIKYRILFFDNSLASVNTNQNSTNLQLEQIQCHACIGYLSLIRLKYVSNRWSLDEVSKVCKCGHDDFGMASIPKINSIEEFYFLTNEGSAGGQGCFNSWLDICNPLDFTKFMHFSLPSCEIENPDINTNDYQFEIVNKVLNITYIDAKTNKKKYISLKNLYYE